MSDGYVLVDSGGRRIKNLDGELTPFFTVPEQAMRYWVKHLNKSPYVFIHAIKEKRAKKNEKVQKYRKRLKKEKEKKDK